MPIYFALLLDIKNHKEKVLIGSKNAILYNLRDKSERDKWRFDTACTDPKTAGDMLLPTFSKGTPEIDKSVYEKMADMWADECARKEGYIKAALNQSNKK